LIFWRYALGQASFEKCDPIESTTQSPLVLPRQLGNFRRYLLEQASGLVGQLGVCHAVSDFSAFPGVFLEKPAGIRGRRGPRLCQQRYHGENENRSDFGRFG
jgi:hypothetical protein